MESINNNDEDIFYSKQLLLFDAENNAIRPYQYALEDEGIADMIRGITIPEWEKASMIVNEMKKLTVSEYIQAKIKDWESYIGLRFKEAALTINICNATASFERELSSVKSQIEEAITRLAS